MIHCCHVTLISCTDELLSVVVRHLEELLGLAGYRSRHVGFDQVDCFEGIFLQRLRIRQLPPPISHPVIHGSVFSGGLQIEKEQVVGSGMGGEIYCNHRRWSDGYIIYWMTLVYEMSMDSGCLFGDLDWTVEDGPTYNSCALF